MNIRDRLELLIEMSGRKESEIARAAQMPQSTLNHFLRGNNRDLKASQVAALADVLNVPAKAILGTKK